jgi:hypothetical protein
LAEGWYFGRGWVLVCVGINTTVQVGEGWGEEKSHGSGRKVDWIEEGYRQFLVYNRC